MPLKEIEASLYFRHSDVMWLDFMQRSMQVHQYLDLHPQKNILKVIPNVLSYSEENV